MEGTCSSHDKKTSKIFAEIPEGQRPRERLRSIWEDNIKMDLKI
jgi:hypothetical protein